MAGIRELRKRLRSVQSIEKLTDAMYTASAAKYSQILRFRSRSQPFSQGCRDMLRQIGGGLERRCETVRPRDALVLLGGNRGMCGGFNAELMRCFDGLLSPQGEPPLLLAGGKMAAAHLRELQLNYEEHFLSDVPAWDEVCALAERLERIYRNGEAERVLFVCQKLENMLVQTPVVVQLLPTESAEGAPETASAPLCLPDRETIGEKLAQMCLEARVLELALDNAAGAQAATMMAMRSASDSARDSADKLESSINRRRQAEVTASVIESTSGSATQGE